MTETVEEVEEGVGDADSTVELIETRAKLDMMQELYRGLLDKVVGVSAK